MLAVVGLGLWLINRFIPMQSTIKSILNVVVIFVVAIWVLSAFGFIGHHLGTIRVG
ncbi:MAG TPA: Thivi_2564 family membrane protein [Nitrospirota bacterium]|nr:Thivi_2564 family membrane protein [Nitrospirota bacterium]